MLTACDTLAALGASPTRAGEDVLNQTFDRINRGIAFLKPGWWLVHAVGIACVYAIGRLLARGG